MENTKIPKILKASQLKHDFTHIVGDIKAGEHFIITHPEVDSVIVSVEKWNSILEEIEDLKNALEAEQEYQDGETFTVAQLTQDVEKMLGKKKK